MRVEIRNSPIKLFKISPSSSEDYYVGFIKDADDSWFLTVGKVFDRNRVSKRYTDNMFLSELLDKVMEVEHRCSGQSSDEKGGVYEQNR